MYRQHNHDRDNYERHDQTTHINHTKQETHKIRMGDHKNP